MHEFDDADMSLDDAIALATRLQEMADRVKRVHAAVPGSQAVWCFAMDGTRYRVVVTVDGVDTETEEGDER